MVVEMVNRATRRLALEDARVSRASGAQQRLGARSGLRNWFNEKYQSVHAAHHHRLTSGKRSGGRGVPDFTLDHDRSRWRKRGSRYSELADHALGSRSDLDRKSVV